MPILWVGLGNPGSAYANTRHNAGFLWIDCLAEYLGATTWKEKFSGLLTAVQHEKFGPVLLLKPQTTMNISGRSVLACMSFFKVDPADLRVAHDDLDLPVGQMKIKLQGSHGGHNGVRDICNVLGNNAFPRLRIGIDRPPSKDMVRDYVLSNFPKDDLHTLTDQFNRLLLKVDGLFASPPHL